jgi:hypothetical protein
VGILSALRPGIRKADLAAAASIVGTALPVTGAPLQLGSPWQDTSGLASVVWGDIFGNKIPRPVTRAEAMAVPAAARARHIICTTVGRVTIRAYRGDQVLPEVPPWERTDTTLPPFHTKLWTADDLMWFGWSCWERENGADGFPLRVWRLPMGSWSFDEQYRVMVDRNDGQGLRYVDQRSVILIPGPHEGLLSFAGDSIRHASDLQRAASRAAKHPAAYLALKQVTGGTPLPKVSEDPKALTIDGLTAMWADAREGENGGVAYLPPGIDAQELGTFDQHLVLDGRNAAAVDIARAASLPADMVDATTQGSLVYQNRVDNDRRGLDYGIGAYMSAMSARLSQNDVCPQGKRQAFDVEEWLNANVPGQGTTTPAATPPAPPVPLRSVPAQEATA